MSRMYEEIMDEIRGETARRIANGLEVERNLILPEEDCVTIMRDMVYGDNPEALAFADQNAYRYCGQLLGATIFSEGDVWKSLV